MKFLRKEIPLLLLCAALLMAVLPTGVFADTVRFPDVPEGAWYETYLDKIIRAQQSVGQMNIISGYPDGTFCPNNEVKRCEWLKMLFEAVEASGNQTAIVSPSAIVSGDHWAKKYYLKAKQDNILVADAYYSTENKTGVTYADNILFTDSYADLNSPITRYEMAVILNNVCTNLSMQKTVIVENPEEHISDYDEIPDIYKAAVEQSYGKGLLMGDENGYFNGDDTLTRAQAVTVLYRYLFLDTVQGDGLQEWASYPKVEEKTSANLLDPSLSFANWLNNGGHVNAYGTLDAEARKILFGNTNKNYFVSASDAMGHMTTVSVPIWTMDKAGNKYPSTCAITVNNAVAEEVKSIFQMIYDDPEQFPIYGGWSAGGTRYTDTMRHSWGCAIDINAYYNCECDFRGWGGSLRITCGYGWWPYNHADRTYAGSMSGQSAYSIGAKEGEYGYSVVKAFKTYGWGWGGQGYSSGKHDFMHFSVMSSGG